MALEELKELAKGLNNEELSELVTSVDNTLAENVAKISLFEKQMQEAIKSRDDVKSKIKNKLNLDEVSDEALDDFLKRTNSSGDELKNTYESKIAELTQNLNNVQENNIKLANKYNLEKQLTSLGAINDTSSPKAYEILLSEIERNSVIDEKGVITFKNQDGTTVLNSNGTYANLQDIYNSFKENQDFKFLFKERKSKNGTGGEQGKNGVPSIGKIDGTRAEQEAYIKAKYNL